MYIYILPLAYAQRPWTEKRKNSIKFSLPNASSWVYGLDNIRWRKTDIFDIRRANGYNGSIQKIPCLSTKVLPIIPLTCLPHEEDQNWLDTCLFRRHTGNENRLIAKTGELVDTLRKIQLGKWSERPLTFMDTGLVTNGLDGEVSHSRSIFSRYQVMIVFVLGKAYSVLASAC